MENGDIQKIERDQQNKAGFMLKHFFPDEVKSDLLAPPQVKSELKSKTLKVSVSFAPGSGEESVVSGGSSTAPTAVPTT